MEQAQEVSPFHPRDLAPGTKIIFIPDGDVYSLRERKESGAGWWLDGCSVGAVTTGVDDSIWLITQQWALYDDTLEEDEVASIGFDVDALDGEDIEAMAQLMHDSNESRVANLEAKAGPGNEGSLENAFDALRMMVFLEQIALKLEITDVCALDFEGRRANMLTGIENKYAQMLAAKQRAESQQRLAGGPAGNRGGVRMVPGPGGKLRPITDPRT